MCDSKKWWFLNKTTLYSQQLYVRLTVGQTDRFCTYVHHWIRENTKHGFQSLALYSSSENYPRSAGVPRSSLAPLRQLRGSRLSVNVLYIFLYFFQILSRRFKRCRPIVWERDNYPAVDGVTLPWEPHREGIWVSVGWFFITLFLCTSVIQPRMVEEVLSSWENAGKICKSCIRLSTCWPFCGASANDIE